MPLPHISAALATKKFRRDFPWIQLMFTAWTIIDWSCVRYERQKETGMQKCGRYYERLGLITDSSASAPRQRNNRVQHACHQRRNSIVCCEAVSSRSWRLEIYLANSARLVKPGFHYPSSRPELTGVKKMHPSWRAVNSACELGPWKPGFTRVKRVAVGLTVIKVIMRPHSPDTALYIV